MRGTPPTVVERRAVVGGYLDGADEQEPTDRRPGAAYQGFCLDRSRGSESSIPHQQRPGFVVVGGLCVQPLAPSSLAFHSLIPCLFPASEGELFCGFNPSIPSPPPHPPFRHNTPPDSF